MKHNFEEEIKFQAKSYAADSLDQRENSLFNKGILPIRTSIAVAAAQGITTPKPDLVFGFAQSRFPLIDAPVLSEETKALIGVAPQLQHAFFSVENKGSQKSIEAAENQALRSGAAMIAADAALNRKAHRKLELYPRKDRAVDTDVPVTKTITISDPTTSDTSLDAAGATINTIAPPQQADETDQEDYGADKNSIAFTCNGTPQMANVHGHRREYHRNGVTSYMTLVRGYLLSNEGHLRDF